MYVNISHVDADLGFISIEIMQLYLSVILSSVGTNYKHVQLNATKWLQMVHIHLFINKQGTNDE